LENKLITLTTDFGLKDPYVGAMKGALLKVNPGAVITDITHLIGAGDLPGAAFVLLGACRYFPPDSIHLAVIDPGVGGVRAALIIETARYTFVGPDNGIFSLALQSEEILRIVRITNAEYFPGPISPTFHGRDIFAPVAGHLSLGVDAGRFGEQIDIDEMEKIALPEPSLENESITGEVIHIDNFGNLITNIPQSMLDGLNAFADRDRVIVRIKEREIKGIKDTYGESADEAALCAITGGTGLIEIALNMGSAADELRSKAGETVKVVSV